MKEKPIIFSTEMVREIISGQKTMTRRVVRIPSWTWDKHDDLQLGRNGELLAVSRKTKVCEVIKPPYSAGDVLWVRETWNTANGRYSYKADWVDFDLSEAFGGRLGRLKSVWKPSIHMPRAAARIFLRVTAVRAERLQAISDSDILAEGVTWVNGTNEKNNIILRRGSFTSLWNSLNTHRGYSWESNPYVWVVSFEKVEV